jgi:hypothetical protein
MRVVARSKSVPLDRFGVPLDRDHHQLVAVAEAQVSVCRRRPNTKGNTEGSDRRIYHSWERWDLMTNDGEPSRPILLAARAPDRAFLTSGADAPSPEGSAPRRRQGGTRT